MSKIEKIIAVVVAIVLVIVIGFTVWVCATPGGRAAWNLWFGNVQKVDDVTNYETRKKVEDTCRAMISSYEADRLTYEQYKDSDSGEKQSWAEQAKMRANRTASTYNNYILENSYVWSDNVPSDIRATLQYLE